MPNRSGPSFQWLCAGDEMFPSMLAAMDAATQSICLEVYIFTDSPLGREFAAALIRAARRGVRVRVLVDAFGSLHLPAGFWNPLRQAGGEARLFNPVGLRRMTIRNHRKLLVCDGATAFIGGFNIAPEYEGDGILRGWCDVGLRIEGPQAKTLESSFDEMFDRAQFRHKRFILLRRTRVRKVVALHREQFLFSGPGRGRNPFKRALHEDLKHAREVRMIIAYFLPTWRLRRDLLRAARRGGNVQLILAGKSDVLLSLLAARSLYRRFLNGNVEIHEYQPQILHAKLIIVDDVVYLGSSNLDTRSLRINYELMVRFDDKAIARQARDIFSNTLKHCRQVTAADWRRSRTLWRRLRQRWAYFLLNRIDPYVARRQWRALPD